MPDTNLTLPGDFELLTFDCYGTLIDWESGLLVALRPLCAKHSVVTTDDQLLELYAQVESEIEAGPYQPYRKVLRTVVARLADIFDFTPDLEDLDCLANSVKDWPPFADTVDALTALKSRFQLAILSNIDDELFADSARQLLVPFDRVITAAQLQTYKPSLDFFNRALDKLTIDRARILHVAQSLYHDHRPAKEIGLATCWINRRHDRTGSGATLPVSVSPDFSFPDLSSFVSAVGLP